MTGIYSRVALFGGVYSNHVALRAAIGDARRRGVERMFCLGDLGAFGPNPDKVFPLLIDHDVVTMQGNYDNSIGHNLPDCQCGYTDPADNHYARLSYQYTYRKTSARWRPWLAGLPGGIRFGIADCRLPIAECAEAATREAEGRGPTVTPAATQHSELSTQNCRSNRQSAIGNRQSIRVLGSHGSPRKTNEFLWESTTPTHLLEKFCDDFGADVIVATHTGLPWMRRLSGGRLFVNCGVLGRPANDGTTDVGYTILDASDPDLAEYVRLRYDHDALAAEMRAEELPEPFVETILTGWWTTCLEILPAKERARGRY